jgi:enoyl-CoA hydratase
MMLALERAAHLIETQAGVRIAIITGEGEKSFCAGGDIGAWSKLDPLTFGRTWIRHGHRALDALARLRQPLIAALNGHTLGGGAELALACDLRVMREGAHIGYIHGRLAITSAWGGGPDLVSLVGPARALRMTARCELVPAALALEWGLADALAPAESLGAALEEFVAPMLRQSGTALRGCKAQARAARNAQPFEQRRAIELDAFVTTWMHADHWAAVDRILDRAKHATKS